MERETMHKRKIFIFSCIVVCLMVAVLAGLKLYRHLKMKHDIEIRNQKGILLSFDDYNEDTWIQVLDLFDQYDAKVTFFVTLSEPTDFCAEAVKRGHEIGYHTLGHVNLTEVSQEEVYKQAIAPIEVFRSAGYDLVTFAYPYGAYTEEINEELLQYYDTLRGAFCFNPKYKESLQKGFIDSFMLDNIDFESDEKFHSKIVELLDGLANCDNGTVASVYSHAIGDGNWCITYKRLEMLLQEVKKRDLVFYTFHELQ